MSSNACLLSPLQNLLAYMLIISPAVSPILKSFAYFSLRLNTKDCPTSSLKLNIEI
jgi:hypothetical protein